MGGALWQVAEHAVSGRDPATVFWCNKKGEALRVLVAELKQETATFNPALSRYDDFQVHHGDEMVDVYRHTRTELAGAMQVLEPEGIEIVPTLAAAAVSGGPIADADLDRLLTECVTAAQGCPDLDGAYICLHGAMAGESEGDPEGRLLCALREVLGDLPMVASLDLHAVITDRLVDAADILVPFHTYPHVDQFETGQRAARLLLRLLRKEIRPVTMRVEMPMLVRGDELITATGKFGGAIRRCQEIEAEHGGLAAGVIIGNAFTDVPDLQSNVLICRDNDPSGAEKQALEIARYMWRHRQDFQAPLTPLAESIALACETEGLTVFSDAADATASGAAGDSNAILKGLLQSDWTKRALVPVVDAPAVAAAAEAGVGAQLAIPLGGTRDPGRFTPVVVDVSVESVHDGKFLYEDGTRGRGGRVVVLRSGSITILVSERPVYVVGLKVFQAHGLEPTAFDLVVVKSPNGFRTHYQELANRIVPVDVPGSTSANLRSLPFQNCRRPMYPLEEHAEPPFDVLEDTGSGSQLDG